ncbi:DUF5666 domain-containing protein [Patescibacteria group bacterium]|nr:DUF5666 domain-containing protein [Patescibacteria group bacterium]
MEYSEIIIEALGTSLGANLLTVIPGAQSTGAVRGAAGGLTTLTLDDAKSIASSERIDTISIDDKQSLRSDDLKSITVKLSDGSSKIILLSAQTQLNKAEVAAKSDLAVGERVAVFGSVNSDGSVNAQNIQLNPQRRGSTPSASPR